VNTDPGTRAAEAIWSLRAGGTDLADRAYVVYVAVMTVICLGIPGGRLLGDALAVPPVLGALTSASAPAAALALVLRSSPSPWPRTPAPGAERCADPSPAPVSSWWPWCRR
jgi:hypothetical protein